MARVAMLLVAMVLVSCSVASAARVLQGEDVYQDAKFKHGHHDKAKPKLPSLPPLPKPKLPTLPKFKLPSCPPPPDSPDTSYDTPPYTPSPTWTSPPPPKETPYTPSPTWKSPSPPPPAGGY